MAPWGGESAEQCVKNPELKGEMLKVVAGNEEVNKGVGELGRCGVFDHLPSEG